jgi:hypothetical protein
MLLAGLAFPVRLFMRPCIAVVVAGGSWSAMNGEKPKAGEPGEAVAHPGRSRFADGGFDLSSVTTVEQCIEVINELSQECLSIETQLDHAEVKRPTTGEWADGAWFVRARTALRYRKQLRAQLQERLSVLKRQERLHYARAWEHRFINAARRMLPHDMFNAIMAEAERGPTVDG